MSKEFRHIVRIAGTDVEGGKKIIYGLTKIRGIGVGMATAIAQMINLDPNVKIGELSNKDVEEIERIIKDPMKHGIPARLMNRRKDLETGKDFHLTGPDLALRVKADIDLMKDVKSWKGVRHMYGLKVRGQRTKTTGRTGKTVGVKKKALIARIESKK
ncbi:MAG: 30S ribosomal protein S13 [Candidatus Bathyarchaeia archaeon]